MDFTMTYNTPAEITHLADGTPFPAYISLTVLRIGLGPILGVTLEVEEGRPVLTGFSFLKRGPGGPPITPSDIHHTKVGDIVEGVIRQVAATALLQEQGVILPGEGDANAADSAAGLARGRRGPTERQLKKTASIWRENKDYDPRKQVANGLFVSERTASRWIALAKERGYIKEED
jgi:hypothetical protein